MDHGLAASDVSSLQGWRASSALPFNRRTSRRHSATWCRKGVSWLLGVFGLSLAAPAAADASSWLYAGAGPSRIDAVGRETAGHFQLDLGMGTSPVNPFVFGGLARMQWHFPDRPDFALLMRAANQAFAAGGWGFAVDLGPYRRWWGRNSTGAMGEFVLGAPFGVTALVGGSLGSADRRTYFASLGIDLARLTVHGGSHTGLWPNPFPSPRFDAAAR